MNPVVVGIGELSVVQGEHAMLRTFSLGSCVAVVLVDRARCVIGMAHVVLPDSDDRSRDAKPAGYYADSGVRNLFDGMTKSGSGLRMGPLHIAVIGGGTAGRSDGGVFNIGARNVNAVRRALAAINVCAAAEDVGGAWSRTVLVSSREIVVTCPDRPKLHL